MSPRIAALAAGAVVLAILVVVLSAASPRRSGTNSIPVAGPIVAVAPGASVCRSGEVLPAGTVAVRVATPGPASVVMTVDGPAGRVATAAARAPAGARVVRFELPEVGRDIPGARVCLRNRGAAPLSLDGSILPGTKRRQPTIDYLRPGDESGWALVPTVAARVGRSGTGIVEGWAFWGALALVAAGWAAGLAAVLRGGRP